MDNMDKETHSTKMGADKLAENTPNLPEFICPIWLPKPKSSGFQWKKASLSVRSLCSNTYKDLLLCISLQNVAIQKMQ